MFYTMKSCVLALSEGFPRVTAMTQRDTLVIEMGFPMRLACSVEGNPKPEVIWYKDKIPVNVTSSNRVQILPRGDNMYCKYS